MSTTLRHSAIAIVMLSSILCTSATSHADTLKSEKIYFSKESIDQLTDWINSNKPISKEIKIGNFNIPLPPGEWKPLPGGLDTGSFIVSKNQIGIELYTSSNNLEQMPDYMLSITMSQSIPFTYLPKICKKITQENQRKKLQTTTKQYPVSTAIRSRRNMPSTPPYLPLFNFTRKKITTSPLLTSEQSIKTTHQPKISKTRKKEKQMNLRNYQTTT